MTALGKEGVDNGVTVKFGANKNGTPASTQIGINANAAGEKVVTGSNPTGQNTVLTIDLSQHEDAAALARNIGHEGSHIADGAALVGALPKNLSNPAATAILAGPLNLTTYQTEVGAYGVTAIVAQALGPGSLKIGPTGGTQYEIWNSEWSKADRATKQAAGIDKVLAEPKSKGGLYEVTTAVQGKRLIDQ